MVMVNIATDMLSGPQDQRSMAPDQPCTLKLNSPLNRTISIGQSGSDEEKG